jgi:hypothetical protein
MRRALAVAAILVLAGISSANAQKVRIGIGALGLTYSETGEDRRWDGGGGAGTLWVRLGRWGIDASGYIAKLKPDSSDVSEFDMVQGDLRASFLIVPLVALEAGFGRRSTDPELAAQDVGYWRIGVLSEAELSRIASIWARGAYLAGVKYDGGGTTSLAVEVALGVGVGTANGRFRVRVDYEFQRFDREVDQVELPIQLSLARLGVEIGF